MKPCIYKITNKINGLCYVGLAYNNPFNRWMSHLSSYDKNLFDKSFSVENIDHWIFEVVEIIEIPEEIQYNKRLIEKFFKDRESYFIEKLNGHTLGYNSNPKKEVESNKNTISRSITLTVDRLFKVKKLAFINKMKVSEYISYLIDNAK